MPMTVSENFHVRQQDLRLSSTIPARFLSQLNLNVSQDGFSVEQDSARYLLSSVMGRTTVETTQTNLTVVGD